MAVVSGKVEARRLARSLARQPEILTRNLRKVFGESHQKWEHAMQGRLRGNPISSRTGALRRSLRGVVSGHTLAALDLEIVSTSPYAKTQEFGDPNRRPRSAKYLTVPMPDNLTPAGVPRLPSARAAMSRDPSIFVLPIKKGQGHGGYIVQRQGDDLKFLWSLRRSVKIPPRLGFFGTWKDQSAWRRRRFRRAVVKTLRGEDA